MRALIIEDDRPTALLLKRAFEKRGHEVSLHDCAESGWQELQEVWFPLAFLDINLPGRSGLDMAKQIRALPEGERCYILVGTAETGPEVLERILAAGADDYIAKPFDLSELNVRIAVAEKRVAEIASLREAQEELTFLARHDPLTRLWNRRELIPAISRTSQNIAVSGSASLLLLDLDYFKQVNDLHGHQAGDELLVQVAEILKSFLPSSSWIIRYGGDEFIAVLPGISAAQTAEVAEEILLAIKSLPTPESLGASRLGASIGISDISPNLSPEECVKRADAACYRAKSRGKNRAEVFVEFDTELLRSSLKRQIHHAQHVPESFLRLFFQPVCDLETGEIFFQEALLRLLKPQGTEAIKASTFFSQITDPAYARSLDLFVIEEIFRELRKHPFLTTSVNISATSLNDWQFVENLERLLMESRVSANRLILEITETHSIQDIKVAEAIARRLQELGVRLALDDFGTGFSSLALLKKLPAQFVKLDEDWTQQIEKEEFSKVMIKAVKVLSQGLGFSLVAERIERIEDLRFAQAHGIPYGQGYLLGHPRAEPWAQKEIDKELILHQSNRGILEGGGI